MGGMLAKGMKQFGYNRVVEGAGPLLLGDGWLRLFSKFGTHGREAAKIGLSQDPFFCLEGGRL